MILSYRVWSTISQPLNRRVPVPEKEEFADRREDLPCWVPKREGLCVIMFHCQHTIKPRPTTNKLAPICSNGICRVRPSVAADMTRSHLGRQQNTTLQGGPTRSSTGRERGSLWDLSCFECDKQGKL